MKLLLVFVAIAAAQKNRKKKLGRDRFPLDGEDLKFEDDSREFGLPDDFDQERDYSAAVDGWDGWFQNFNWTQYIAGDDVAEEFFRRPAMVRNGMSLQERLEYRKFKTLKLMIMYLQTLPLFGKFCYYGCYCFPNVGEDFTVGRGTPVDEVDKKCRDFSSCYKCVANDFRDTCKHTQPYSFEGREDPVTGSRYLVCKNTPGTCRRSLCECDKRLAEELAANEWFWVPMNHKNWGGFDKQESCRSASGGSSSRSVMEKQEPVYRCCGKYPDRFPFQFVTSTGEQRRCCLGKTYDPKTLECCNRRPTPGITSIGTCGL